MNLFKFFQKDNKRKKDIQSLKLFYCLFDVWKYLMINYNDRKNILIINLIKLVDWCRNYQFSQISDYAQFLDDYIFWQSRDFYRESMQKFVLNELTGSEFVDRVLDLILYHREEGRSLQRDFDKQLTIELDPKSFKFSKIIFALVLPLEDFYYPFEEDKDDLNDDDDDDFTEEMLRKVVKQILIEVEKYFKD